MDNGLYHGLNILVHPKEPVMEDVHGKKRRNSSIPVRRPSQIASTATLVIFRILVASPYRRSDGHRQEFVHLETWHGHTFVAFCGALGCAIKEAGFILVIVSHFRRRSIRGEWSRSKAYTRQTTFKRLTLACASRGSELECRGGWKLGNLRAFTMKASAGAPESISKRIQREAHIHGRRIGHLLLIYSFAYNLPTSSPRRSRPLLLTPDPRLPLSFGDKEAAAKRVLWRLLLSATTASRCAQRCSP
ncbi:hypothetical protein BKA70DRAFT_874658 [Coprinopsis sp. MPI-PUGE-AT-0042]|nr:hypothetical protein BKA70DRAFT_874658 [Coprinopsis sp. MPI-PUGE-AT-0042]